MSVKEIYAFEVLSSSEWNISIKNKSFKPNYFVDISKSIKFKLKALKYYLVSFRDRGIFYEQVTNQILDDLVAACSPHRMVIVGDFSVRGGITTTVTATYQKVAPPSG